jgi:twinkle protein
MLDQPTLSPEHAKLLQEKRGVSSATAQALGLISQGNSLGFPYPGFTKWRGPSKHFWIEPKGAALNLFNLQAIKGITPGDTLIITEGEFDAASCIDAGGRFVVSVPNGAPPRPGSGDVDPFTDKQFSYLWYSGELLPELQRPKKIILAVDGDEPGLILRDELAIRLGPERCYGVVWPSGCKDANEVVCKHGVAALTAALKGAFPFVTDELKPIDEIPVRSRAEQFLSGWHVLDPHLVVVPPELMVVTGKPSSGKSQWVTNLFLNISRLYGVNGAFIQLEDDVERTRGDLTSYAEHWFDKVDADGCFSEAQAFLHKHIRVVAPNEDLNDKRDLKWLQRTIELAATRHDCKWVVIDPWNEVEHMFGKGQNEAQYLNDAVREIKIRARRYNICICIVCHPDKASGKVESIDEMTLYSISGGAVWKNKADHGIVIGREPETWKTFVKIDKSKNWTLLGQPGQVDLEFDRASRCYIEAGKRGPRVVPVATEKTTPGTEPKATGTDGAPGVKLNMKETSDDGAPF